uniref:Serine/threonine specific protein phosphatases domain-containing protein n=1 Tax=Timema monikensis TaxID=170555 RepID=A0A7R9E686_9NEOP|nr:unnamed protein product [Timema monikensis]
MQLSSEHQGSTALLGIRSSHITRGFISPGDSALASFRNPGNHESQTMNQMYGFEGEVKSKYTAQMSELFTEVYNWLPLAHCLNSRVLVMHGGLFSRDDVTLDEIRKIDRNRQPPEDGVMCELLWSDPQEQPGRAPSKRGVGVQFGPDVTEKFVELNKLDYIIRSHEITWAKQNCLPSAVPLFFKRNRSFAASKPVPREDPVIMKLDSPEFKSIFTPELTKLATIFKEYGYEIRIAGGAVRDLLLKQKPKDLDFATTATPEQMKEMFSAEEIRMINVNGEKHGTVTPRINDSVNFEVTTLRIDVRTDGRHAEVEFTTDWKLDANRRDLTINSMFLEVKQNAGIGSREGNIGWHPNCINDPFKKQIASNGMPENIKLKPAHDVRKRFYGRIAQDPDKHEEKTLQSIQDNADGLKRISGERIWTELQQILEGNFACELVKTMLSLDLGPPIGVDVFTGLPENPNLVEFDKVWQRVKHLKYHSMTLLSALFRNQEEVMTFHSRVKLSAYERDLGLFILANREDKPSIKPLRPYQMLVLTTKVKVSDTRKWVEEVFKYRGNAELLQQFMEWEIPKFPVSGHMLKENGVPGGKRIGLVLNKLKEHWADSDFTASSEDLLKQIPTILSELDIPITR